MLKLELYKYLKVKTNNPIITIQKIQKRRYQFYFDLFLFSLWKSIWI